MATQSRSSYCYRCDRCGKITGYWGMWWHTLVQWPWWRIWDKNSVRICR